MVNKPRYGIGASELRQLHREQKMTPQEVAEHYGCSRALIYHYLKKFEIEKLPKHQRLQGKKYGRLLVKKFLSIDENRQAQWLCICDCGKTTVATTGRLNNGLQSCGCLTQERSTTHGMSNSRPYRIWLAMKSRCDNPNTFNYCDYGERGISYCPRWSSFENFWEDMRNGYDPKKSIDRIDNDGDYCPNNCRWASCQEQASHKSNSVLLTYKGKTLNATQWAQRLGVPRYIIYSRKRAGWDDERVIETPYQPRNP